MEENRLCENCKKNHAVRSYEGGTGRKFYCLQCYSHLFLEVGEEGELTACPYCGTTLAEVNKGKLVGCAHCYETLQSGIFPMVKKMQGARAHRGKTPPLDGEYIDPYDFTNPLGAELRANAMKKARFERQRGELEIIIKKLKAEGNFEDAKGYEEKLTAMKSKAEVEEDFVWRTRRSLSRQS